MKIIKKSAAFILSAAMAATMLSCVVSADPAPAEAADSPVGATAAAPADATAEAQADTSADETAETASDEAPAEGWTIFIYMCGSNLESEDGSGTYNLDEIVDSTFSDEVTVVVETGGAYEWKNEYVSADQLQRFVRTEDGMELVDSQPDALMSEESTLEDFIKWGLQNYSSEYMGLIVWDHGGGSIGGVCIDDKDAFKCLLLTDIAKALSNTSEYLPGGFEFIGFDACLMATLETASVLAPYAHYMYASQELEPGTGWDYTAILSYLADDPLADGADLGQVQMESYYDKCNLWGDDPSITFSITDLTKIADLNSALDTAAKEMLESDKFNSVIRGIVAADNFGGNNKVNGYTNMVDLLGILKNVEEYAPSASAAIEALNTAVVNVMNGASHKDAGGLSVYYPIHISGTEEIPIFTDIATSTYYLALVDKMAEGAELSATGEDTIGTIHVNDVYIDEDGTYTVELDGIDNLAYATCSLYMEDVNDGFIYLGEDDDIICDVDNNIITDNFDGLWLSIDDNLAPVTTVSQNDEVSIYTCPIQLNGESTNLRIQFDWATGEYSILGTWDGVDPETNIAAREQGGLNEGDVINFVYQWYDYDENEDTYVSNDIIYSDDIQIAYTQLWDEHTYDYAINLYDVFGNSETLTFEKFTVDEDGTVHFTDNIEE